MLIVDYETFIRMPAGTIFAPYKPCVFEEGFQIKVDGGQEFESMFTGEKKWAFNGTMPLEPWFDDYIYPDTYGQWDTNFEVYDGDSNDAAEYKMFAVLEPHEIQNLINILLWAANRCIGDPLTVKRFERASLLDGIHHEIKKGSGKKENAET